MMTLVALIESFVQDGHKMTKTEYIFMIHGKNKAKFGLGTIQSSYLLNAGLTENGVESVWHNKCTSAFDFFYTFRRLFSLYL